mmetsp:Transcript_17222/g.15108  ORF Transcript_17222/g.15108 Transcript_17222/m.15108 type:complete len:83 (-) Transcript_17222:237-485(-)
MSLIRKIGESNYDKDGDDGENLFKKLISAIDSLRESAHNLKNELVELQEKVDKIDQRNNRYYTKVQELQKLETKNRQKEQSR